MTRRFFSAAASSCAVFILLALGACAPTGSGSSQPGPVAASPDAVPVVPSVEQIGETIATVNGMPIGGKEFDHMAMRQVSRDGSIGDEARQDIIDRLVDEKLLYQEALRQGIDKDPKLQKMMVNTLLKEAVYNSVRTGSIGDDELRSYFESHKEDFVVPAKVQVKRILIKSDAGEPKDAVMVRAKAVREEVMAHRDDFKNIAQRFSSGPYARRGGDMGFVTEAGKPGVPEAVIAEAFKLSKGQVSEPFASDDGWNIVYVPNRRDRVERTFEQMRGSVQRKVKSERYKKLFEDYVGGLKVSASIDINESLVMSRTVEPPKPGASASARRPSSRPPAANPGADSGSAAGLKGHGPDDGHGH